MARPKKRNLEQKDYFTAMNDDCINEVLSRLELVDLCAISRTCKQLRNLAGREFQRKYPEKKIYILEKTLPCSRTPASEITVVLPLHEIYVKCFSPIVQNIYVNLRTHCLAMELAAFIQTHINRLPKKIEFRRCHLYINKSLAEGIKPMLEIVESVVFSGCHGNKNNFYNEILKHCKRLKYLEVKPMYHTTFDLLPPRLPLNEHPHLEFFDCNFKDKQMTENLDVFLQLNSNVKRLVCTFGIKLTEFDIKRCFQAVAEYSKNLDDVCFAIEQHASEGFNLTLIADELKVLSRCDRIKRCELNLFHHGISMKSTATAAVFTGLRCGGHCIQFIIKSNTPFNKLRTLIFTNQTQLNKQTATDLSYMLPNLEILSFGATIFESYEKITDVVTPFARHSQRLEELHLLGCNFAHYCEAINLEFLSEERKKLEGASKFTINLSETFCENCFMKISKKSVNDDDNLVHQARAKNSTNLTFFNSFALK